MRIPVIRVAPVVLPFLLLSACAEMGAIACSGSSSASSVSVTDRVTDTPAYPATGRELQLVVAGERLDAWTRWSARPRRCGWPSWCATATRDSSASRW
jgi:hypothetical protein